MRNYRVRVSALAVLVLALVVVLSAGAEPPPETASASPSFTLSTDPEVVVLSVVSRYQRSSSVWALELRGNGNLLLTAKPAWRGRDEYQIRLDYLEMAELVDVAVSAGLVEVTAAGIEAKRRAKAGFWATSTPPGMVDVKVRLDTYTRDGRTLRDVRNAVGYGANYAGSHPEIAELQGLAELSERLDALFYRAAGIEPPEPEPELDFLPFTEPEPTTGSIERRTDDGRYHLAKRRLPVSELFAWVFQKIDAALSTPESFRPSFLLDTFGIEKGSAEERAFLDAFRAALAAEPSEDDLVRRSEELAAVRTQAGDDAAMRRSEELLEEDAHRRGVVWGRMTVALGGPGSPVMVKINEYADRSRQDMSLSAGTSFEDPDHTIWKLERAFQQGVDAGMSGN